MLTKDEALDLIDTLIAEVELSRRMNLLAEEGEDEMVEGWLSNRHTDLIRLREYVTNNP